MDRFVFIFATFDSVIYYFSSTFHISHFTFFSRSRDYEGGVFHHGGVGSYRSGCAMVHTRPWCEPPAFGLMPEI